jgi:hypothetical protein
MGVRRWRGRRGCGFGKGPGPGRGWKKRRRGSVRAPGAVVAAGRRGEGEWAGPGDRPGFCRCWSGRRSRSERRRGNRTGRSRPGWAGTRPRSAGRSAVTVPVAATGRWPPKPRPGRERGGRRQPAWLQICGCGAGSSSGWRSAARGAESSRPHGDALQAEPLICRQAVSAHRQGNRSVPQRRPCRTTGRAVQIRRKCASRPSRRRITQRESAALGASIYCSGSRLRTGLPRP